MNSRRYGYIKLRRILRDNDAENDINGNSSSKRPDPVGELILELAIQSAARQGNIITTITEAVD